MNTTPLHFATLLGHPAASLAFGAALLLAVTLVIRAIARAVASSLALRRARRLRHAHDEALTNSAYLLTRH